jgi:hypothetical protein
MSAKLTVLFFIVICFEVGILLVYLPWHPSWNENHLLVYAVDRLHWSWVVGTVTSGYFRGAVTGLGLLNIMLGGWEIVNFKKTVRSFQSELNSEGRPGADSSGVSDNPPETTGAE